MKAVPSYSVKHADSAKFNNIRYLGTGSIFKNVVKKYQYHMGANL